MPLTITSAHSPPTLPLPLPTCIFVCCQDKPCGYGTFSYAEVLLCRKALLQGPVAGRIVV